MSRLGRSVEGLIAAALVLGCEDEKPYTPFGVASAAPSALPSASAIVAEASDAGKFAPKRAVVAPRAASSWKLGGRARDAPEKRVFERGVLADFDGDGGEDALVWTVPAADAPPLTPRGELWFYPKTGEPRRALPMPSFIPSAPGCDLTTSLTQTGPKTATVDVAARCKTPALAGSATRALAIVAPHESSPLVVGLRIVDPPPGETVTWNVESTDRDEDGRDDVFVTATLAAGDARATAPLSWFDRATGAARDATEPALALAKRASVENVRSRKPKSGTTVAAQVGAVRRLYSTLCGESDAARVTTWDGQTIECGDLTKTVARLLGAEVGAALSLGQTAEAFAALDRSAWYAQPVDEKSVAALEKKVLSTVTTRSVGPPVLPNVTVQRRTGPRFSPLAFEANGDLLVVSRSGLTRTKAGGSSTEPVSSDAAVRAWSLFFTSPSGATWKGVNFPCHRPGVLLLVENADGSPADPIETSILSPRPCPTRPPATPLPAALGWTDEGLDAIVAGSSLAPSSRGSAKPGTPRSPDGRLTIRSNRRGLLVTGGAKPELWRGDTIPDPLGLGDCVVANGALAAACVDGTRVLWLEPE